MSRQISLRPVDVPVALRMAEAPLATFESLGHDLGISQSTAHDSVKRLEAAGLLRPHDKRVNRAALLEFLEHGVRYAFPPVSSGGTVRGVVTAHAAPAFQSEIISENVIVWPDVNGPNVGEALQPLYDKATILPERCRSLYEMLTLVDALRIGRSREKKIAVSKLRDRLVA
jgi:DNA-binding Lrp family transcriptional regulator